MRRLRRSNALPQPETKQRPPWSPNVIVNSAELLLSALIANVNAQEVICNVTTTCWRWELRARSPRAFCTAGEWVQAAAPPHGQSVALSTLNSRL